MKTRTHRVILLGLLALVLAGIVAYLALTTYDGEVDAQKERAQLNAKVYAQDLNKDFQRGITITETLAAVLEQNNGTIDNFDLMAQRLTKDFVGSVQLAPNGVVTQIYPLEGNEEGLGSLMDGGARQAAITYGREHRMVTMQGPFDLRQGGQGIAIRNPVFITDSNGNEQFWGYTIVIIKVPDVFNETLGALTSFGYDYSVDSTTSPVSDTQAQVASSIADGNSMDDAESASFVAGGCTWTLHVKPSDGWTSPSLLPTLTAGAGSSLLLLFLAGMIFDLTEQRKRLRYLAARDELTGLYSRRGFINLLETKAKEHPERTRAIIYLDLDDFKVVNDQFGHQICDEALKNMARNMREVFPDDALLARTGGDEFSVALLDLDSDQCEELVKKMVAKDQTFTIDGQNFTYTISAGFAMYPDQTDNPTDLLVLADQALYSAKMAGKHRYAKYDSSMIKLKRSQLGFSITTFAAGIPGAILVCRARADTGYEILFGNKELVKLFDCDNLVDFMNYADRGFMGLVYPDDRERMQSMISYRTAIHDSDASPEAKGVTDVMHYRVITKHGGVRDVVNIGRMSETEKYGSVVFIFMRPRASVDFGGSNQDQD